ncbi:MAG: hypothetical protein M1335_02355 [Chloroflexi bacterium]|nr:hypothetical protein [Chloroflexota bacterium]
MDGRGKAIFGLLMIGIVAVGFFGLGLQGAPQCSIFGCPLNAGVFAAAGARAAQMAFALATLLAVFLMILAAPALPVPARFTQNVYRASIRPSGAAQRKLGLWRSLRETSPTTA